MLVAMASFKASSDGSKTLQLTAGKVANLLGCEERLNLVLLEDVCQIHIEVMGPAPPSTVGGDEGDKLGSEQPSTPPSSAVVVAAAEDEKLDVVLTSCGYADFSDKAYQRKVHQYVKSASRGGFICWFKRSEFESSKNQSTRQRVRNLLDRVKREYPFVECILQRVDMRWSDAVEGKIGTKTTFSPVDAPPPKPLGRVVNTETGDEDRAVRVPSLCLCVLPAATVPAATTTGGGKSPGSGLQDPDKQLDAAIALLQRAENTGWKNSGGGGGGGNGALQAGGAEVDFAPSPKTIQELKEYRQTHNTKQRNKLKAEAAPR